MSEQNKGKANNEPADISQMIGALSGTLQSLDKKIDTLASKQTALEEKVLSIDAKANGKDAGFESDLKKSVAVEVNLTDAERAEYGEPASPKFMEIVHQVLGADFAAFSKHNELMPMTHFTIVMPDRFLGSRTFHSSILNDHKAEQEARKWCEYVKTWLFTQYKTIGKSESPTFDIISRK